ncbi:hypothetical protein OUZ56_020685 [Daphnia magna]|uniref:Uncharacterized protein n=1 Tax=Daphnia magna TaxID=35525 RepID=A0ABQ9ZF56_9CRUS|nr:hypothetical protein OUZ56_020685 [Daphnia magna]
MEIFEIRLLSPGYEILTPIMTQRTGDGLGISQIIVPTQSGRVVVWGTLISCPGNLAVYLPDSCPCTQFQVSMWWFGELG